MQKTNIRGSGRHCTATLLLNINKSRHAVLVTYGCLDTTSLANCAGKEKIQSLPFGGGILQRNSRRSHMGLESVVQVRAKLS